MLSTLSPLLQAESLLAVGGGLGFANANIFLSSQGGFMPWETLESFFVQKPNQGLGDESKPNLSRHNDGLGLDLDDPDQLDPLDFDKASGDLGSPNQNSTISSSGSDDPDQNSGGSNSSPSHYDEPNQTESTIVDERKRKRMVSNRESARRSRMRKQRHVENLRDEANRLKIENQEGTNRLRFVNHNIHLVKSDNDRLRAEYVILQRRLMELNQIWQLQQLHRNNNNHDAFPCMSMQFIRPNNEQIMML